MHDLRISDERVNDLIARNLTIEYLLFELSKRISERHSQRQYLKKLSEGAHIIKSALQAFLIYLEEKESDLKLCIENVTFFRTNLNPTEKEMKDMAYFKLEKKHQSVLKSRRLQDMPGDIVHDIVGDIKISDLESYGVIDTLTFAFGKDIKRDLFLHYSHDKIQGWKFEVIFYAGKTKDLIGNFSLSNKDFIDIKRTANSEAKREIKGIGTLRMGPFIMFLNSRMREQIV